MQTKDGGAKPGAVRQRVHATWPWLAWLAVLLAPLHAHALDRGKQVLLTRDAQATSLLAAVEDAVWAADGQAADRPVYVVYSTECSWSKRLYDETRALAGKVQLRWIPVAGRQAGEVAAHRDAASVGDAFAGRAARAQDAASARRAVEFNAATMDSITYQLRPHDNSRTFAFPTLVYRTAQGVKVVAGNPRNLAALPAEVLREPAKAGLVPLGVELTRQPVPIVRSRNLPKWSHRQATPVVFRVAPSPRAAPIDDLEKDFLLPVSGIVGDSGWIEVAPWGADKRKTYVHDPLMARMALLDFRVRPQGGQWQVPRAIEVREFPDAEAPVLETLRAGERYRRSGEVEIGGRVWDQIVLYVDGTVGYTLR